MLKVYLHVYKLCLLCKHLLHSHTKLYAMSRKCCHNHSTIYLKHCTCHSHPLVRHTKHMLSCWFEMSYRQVMLSVCPKVMYTRVHSLTHLTILSKICRPDHSPPTRPPRSCVVQSQPLVTKYCYSELHRAWVCLLDSMHCSILESTWLTVNFHCKRKKLCTSDSTFSFIDKGVLCRIFTLTFIGKSKRWCEFLPIVSIYNCDDFLTKFLHTFEDYDYEYVCNELENQRQFENEFTIEFTIRFKLKCLKFKYQDKLSDIELT